MLPLGFRHACSSLAALAALTLATQACSNTDTSSPGPTEPIVYFMSKVAGDSQTATVATSTAVAPLVLVKNAMHQPVAGVKVRFVATSGGGTIGDSSTTTNSQGLASAGDWSLGKLAGINTLTAFVDNTDPVVFSATGTAGPPSRMIPKDWRSRQIVSVAQSLWNLPTVLVTDGYGNRIGGVAVMFAVTSGGGSATGTQTTTDSLGIARVGSWTMGTRSGVNTMTASALQLNPVVFDVNALAGPSRLQKISGDGQTGHVSTALPDAPGVKVLDENDNPVVGLTVDFTVLSGGGTLGAGLWFAEARTNSNGIATAGVWRLGPVRGVQTIGAWAPTAGNFVTFTARAEGPTCASLPDYTVGNTVQGDLTTSDCWFASAVYPNFVTFADQFRVAVSDSTSMVDFSLTTTGGAAYLVLTDAAERELASSPVLCPGTYHCTTDTRLRVLMPAGLYTIRTAAFKYDYDDQPSNGVEANYTLYSSKASEDVTGCIAVYLAGDLSTRQKIEPSDCTTPNQPASTWYDGFLVHLDHGDTLTASMESTDFDTYLDLFSVWGYEAHAARPEVYNDDFGGTTNSQITFVADRSAEYLLRARTVKEKATGSYVLTIHRGVASQATSSNQLSRTRGKVPHP